MIAITGRRNVLFLDYRVHTEHTYRCPQALGSALLIEDNDNLRCSPFFRLQAKPSFQWECTEALLKKLTLHDASMLWSVTQTAETLRTGDHSVPRIEAQILCLIRNGTACWPGCKYCAHMSVGVYMLTTVNCHLRVQHWIHTPDAQEAWSPGRRQTELRALRWGNSSQNETSAWIPPPNDNVNKKREIQKNAPTWYRLSPRTSMEKNQVSKSSALSSVMPGARVKSDLFADKYDTPVGHPSACISLSSLRRRRDEIEDMPVQV